MFSTIPNEEDRHQAVRLLISASPDELIAPQLVELFGYDNIDQVTEAVQRRNQLKKELSSKPTSPMNPHAHLWEPSAPELAPSHAPAREKGAYVPQAQIVFETLQSKAEAKRARNEARKHAHQQHKNSRFFSLYLSYL